MKPHFLAAVVTAVAVLADASPAPAQDILTTYGHITLLPGQSIQRIITQAALRSQMIAKAHSAVGKKVVPAAANVQPTINSGAVISDTLEVGDVSSVPVIQFNYATGPSGLTSAGFTFTSPNGDVNLNLDYYAADTSRKGNIVLQSPFTAPYFAQPGKWKLTSAYIVDGIYNTVTYSAAQATALIQNPVINVLNAGPVDFTPPVVKSGKILTPSVSLSSPDPQFLAKLSGTDNLSGVAVGYVIIQAPGASYGQTETTYAPIAFTNGSLEVAAPVYAYEGTGTWSITGFILCDIASNCTSDVQTPAEVNALFGTTTFTVTN